LTVATFQPILNDLVQVVQIAADSCDPGVMVPLE